MKHKTDIHNNNLSGNSGTTPHINVAILGGAFNPVTLGHIQIATYVLSSTTLFDEVWLLPCYQHIYNKTMESTKRRLEMCHIAVLAHEQIKVCDYEIMNQFIGGTYYLMKQLLAEDFIKNTYDCSLIIGQDNANTFDKWVKHKELEQLIRFVIVPRQGIEKNPAITWYLHPPHLYLEGDKPVMKVSSTQVRELLKQGDYSKASELLDPTVLTYIREHNLYEA